MKRKKTNPRKFLFFSFLVIAIISNTILLTTLSIFQTKPINMIQYAGSFDGDEPTGLIASNIANIKDITVRVVQIENFAGESSCEANVCKGELTSTDENGCDIWETEQRYYDVAKCSNCYRDTSDVSSNTYNSITLACKEAKELSYNNCQPLYKIVKCGGFKVDPETEARGCWGKYLVTRNDQVEFDSKVLSQNNFNVNVPFGDSGELKIILHNSHRYSDGRCRHIDNSFMFVIPSDAFIINISAPDSAILQGDEGSVDVIVINNFMDDINAKLIVDYKVETNLLNPSTETREKMVSLSKGFNKFTYEIPTGKVTDEVKLTVKMDVLLPGNNFQGVNGICYGQTDKTLQPLSACENVLLGSTEPESHTTKILKSIPPICIEAGFDDIVSCNDYIENHISDLLTNIKGQEETILELSQMVDVNAEHISSMEATIDEQVATINALELNIDEKEQMIGEMREIIANSDEELEFMLESIRVLEIDNEELKRIINNYDSTIDEDAELIGNLELSNDELKELVDGYKGNLAKEQALVEALKLKNDDLRAQLDDMESGETKESSSSSNTLEIAGLIAAIIVVAIVVAIIKKKR